MKCKIDPEDVTVIVEAVADIGAAARKLTSFLEVATAVLKRWAPPPPEARYAGNVHADSPELAEWLMSLWKNENSPDHVAVHYLSMWKDGTAELKDCVSYYVFERGQPFDIEQAVEASNRILREARAFEDAGTYTVRAWNDRLSSGVIAAYTFAVAEFPPKPA